MAKKLSIEARELKRLQAAHDVMLAEYNATKHQRGNAVVIADFLGTLVEKQEAALEESFQAIQRLYSKTV